MSLRHTFTDSGILLVDKPVGMSSAQVVGRIKRISGARKVGHSGTLDPFASGLMIVGVNHGTRLMQFFLSGDKRYTAEITFGSETDTLDVTGTVLNTCSDDFFTSRPSFFTEANIIGLLEPFTGPQLQKPPVYSALKHKGVPLYKLARKGAPVEKEARHVVIHHLDLLNIAQPAVTVDVRCSKGTYIRSLAADIGKAADCGAFLSGLIRTEGSGFSLENACSLDHLTSPESVAEAMISMNDALPGLPLFQADEALLKRVKNGITISHDSGFLHAARDFPFVKVVDCAFNLVAILEYDKTTNIHNYCCVFLD